MNVDIAERLAKRRREAGLSQENLAEKLGVSRQAVSKWERSESSPDTDNLIALAQLYGVSLDDLLYVDESFKEDVEFEAADRAESRKTVEDSFREMSDYFKDINDGIDDISDAIGGKKKESSDDASSAQEKKKKVKVGPAGVHALDGDDYVHVSWKDGVHVKDSKDGDEVHVGWGGVHVKEGKNKKKCGDWVGMQDDEGNTVSWDNAGVIINGEKYDSWWDAHEKFGPGRWEYVVNGEIFKSVDDARAKYGSGVGEEIPVERRYKSRTWMKFPFPLLAIIVYILIGVFAGAWGMGLFVFFTIPLYYMIGDTLASKRIAPFLEGFYPLACIAWFLYMAFVLNQPHPAWIIFLTIPLVEWFIHSLSRWWRHRKKEPTIIDVEGEVN